MRLLVVLASPPLRTSGVRTLNSVAVLLDVFPYARLTVANLYADPTSDLPAMTSEATGPGGWQRARQILASEIDSCDGIFAAWGVTPLSGRAGVHRQQQLSWLLEFSAARGLATAWTVGGLPRHPSRWHQYVSDKYGRTNGGSLSDRLTEVIREVPLNGLAARPNGIRL